MRSPGRERCAGCRPLRQEDPCDERLSATERVGAAGQTSGVATPPARHTARPHAMPRVAPAHVCGGRRDLTRAGQDALLPAAPGSIFLADGPWAKFRFAGRRRLAMDPRAWVSATAQRTFDRFNTIAVVPATAPAQPAGGVAPRALQPNLAYALLWRTLTFNGARPVRALIDAGRVSGTHPAAVPAVFWVGAQVHALPSAGDVEWGTGAKAASRTDLVGAAFAVIAAPAVGDALPIRARSLTGRAPALSVLAGVASRALASTLPAVDQTHARVLAKPVAQLPGQCASAFALFAGFGVRTCSPAPAAMVLVRREIDTLAVARDLGLHAGAPALAGQLAPAGAPARAATGPAATLTIAGARRIGALAGRRRERAPNRQEGRERPRRRPQHPPPGRRGRDDARQLVETAIVHGVPPDPPGVPGFSWHGPYGHRPSGPHRPLPRQQSPGCK